MANFNKVIFIGRLTRDPESRTFANGGKVVNFGFAVTNRKKNQQTGQWEDEPMFIDCKIFNRSETNPQADRAEQNLRKGQQVFLEGHLVFEQWEDKNGGGKRSKHALVVDNFQYLEVRQDGGSGSSSYQQRKPMASAPSRPESTPSAGGDYYDEGPQSTPSGNGGGTDEIPF